MMVAVTKWSLLVLASLVCQCSCRAAGVPSALEACQTIAELLSLDAKSEDWNISLEASAGVVLSNSSEQCPQTCSDALESYDKCWEDLSEDSDLYKLLGICNKSPQNCHKTDDPQGTDEQAAMTIITTAKPSDEKQEEQQTAGKVMKNTALTGEGIAGLCIVVLIILGALAYLLKPRLDQLGVFDACFRHMPCCNQYSRNNVRYSQIVLDDEESEDDEDLLDIPPISI